MKKFLSASVLGMVILTPNVTNNVQAQADSVKEVSLPQKEKSVITNIDSQLSKINNYYYKDNIHYKVFDSYKAIRLDKEETNIRDFNMEVSGVKNIQMKDTTPEYIGYNTFTNTTNTPQNYYTVSFAHKSTKTSSTTVNDGFSLKKGVTNLKVPVLLPNGIKLPIAINANSTSTTTASEEITLTIPPQQVNVPAHKTYKVEVNYLKKSLTGDIDFKGTGQEPTSALTALMSWTGGMGRPNKQRTFNYQTKTLWNSLSSSQKNNIQGIKFNNKDFYIDGTASLKGIVGTEFEVKTYDITNRSAPTLVSSERVNLIN